MWVCVLTSLTDTTRYILIYTGDVGEIGRAGGMLLAKCFQAHGSLITTLQILSLEGNNLGWRGLGALVPFFTNCATLHIVNLARNELGPLAAGVLLTIPRESIRSWTTLLLHDNWLEDDKSQKDIVAHFEGTEVVFGDQDDADEEDDDDDDEAAEEAEQAEDAEDAEEEEVAGGEEEDEEEEEEFEEMSQQLSQLNV